MLFIVMYLLRILIRPQEEKLIDSLLMGPNEKLVLNKGLRKHQPEIIESKPKRNTSHQKVESVNNKIAMVMQNRYYNSPSSLIHSAQQTKAPNTRLHSAYRKTDASSNGKQGSHSSKPSKDFSRIHHIKGDSFIKNSKTNACLKQRKSESIRKVKQKSSQHMFTYQVSNVFPKQAVDVEDHFVSAGKSSSQQIALGGSGGTDGMYRLSTNLVHKLPSTNDMKASKAVKAYINKNKKILKNAIQNDIYMHNNTNNRKLSTISKSSKGKKDNSKKNTSSYSLVKDKGKLDTI